MGTAFVIRMLEHGEKVTVWNRTAARALPLGQRGASVAPDAASAVRGASRVHLSLLDDASVDQVLEVIVPELMPGAIVMDHSTTATHSTVERAGRMRQRGVAFLHCPVFMGPANALAATGSIFVAGPQDVFAQVRQELEAMTGTVRYVGERPDLAAAYKLFGNMMMMFVMSGVADVLSLARSLGIVAADVIPILEALNPAKQIATRGPAMASGEFTPAAFELSAARKDIRLMLESAAAAGGNLHVLPAIANRFDEIISAGYGQADVTAIAADVP